MPPPEKTKVQPSRQPDLAPQRLKVVAPPGLHPHHSEAIATLTAKGRSLYEEMVANTATIDSLQERNAVIRRSLAEIRNSVIEHAWDGQPIP